MAQFMVLHTYLKSIEEYAAAFPDEAVMQFAQAMATGQTPAKCVTTWDPSQHGRLDHVFCLWEAEKAEDVRATLEGAGLLEFLTADIMQVDATDWAAVAKAAG